MCGPPIGGLPITRNPALATRHEQRSPICVAAVLRAVLAALALLMACGARADPAPPWFQAALSAACTGDEGVQPVLAAVGGGIELGREDLDAPRGMKATRHRLLLTDGGRLRVDRHRRGDALRQVILEWHGYRGARREPVLWVVADGNCRVRAARRLLYDDGPAAVEDLTPDLESTRTRLALDAPLPEGKPVAGVPVAMVDSGVNYTLPPVASRLARDGEGRVLGYDYWDLDPRPFDHHPSRSPFIPARHGTRTAGVVLEDGPQGTTWKRV